MRAWLKHRPSYPALLVGCVMVIGGGLVATRPADSAPPEIKEEQFRPKWKAGDKWVIETHSQSVQVRDEKVEDEDKQPGVKWEFTVGKTEKIAGHDCYRVEVRCLEPGAAQPSSVLWIDQKTMTLRQFQTQIPVPGGFRTVTESYVVGEGQQAPVLGPLTALPIDLPLFTPGSSRATKFSYEAITGPAGKRAVGDVGFAVDIEQSIQPAKAEDLQKLLPQAMSRDLSKDLEKKPVVDVKLKTPEREVRQLWQAGQPWPVYSDNGQTKAKLIKVTPAQPRN